MRIPQKAFCRSLIISFILRAKYLYTNINIYVGINNLDKALDINYNEKKISNGVFDVKFPSEFNSHQIAHGKLMEYDYALIQVCFFFLNIEKNHFLVKRSVSFSQWRKSSTNLYSCQFANRSAESGIRTWNCTIGWLGLDCQWHDDPWTTTIHFAKETASCFSSITGFR